MMNWNSILRQSFIELFGFLGAVVVMMYFLHYAVHSAALEKILVLIIEPFLLNNNNGNPHHQSSTSSGIYQMILTPISILRHVSQKSLEDAGSIWLSVVILLLAFVGAAIDFVLGNFCRQLAFAVGVRLDAIEMVNTDWDAVIASAGTKGSTEGSNGVAPPRFADPQQQQQVPAQHKLTPENIGKYKNPGADGPKQMRRR